MRCRLAKNVPQKIPSIAKIAMNLDQSTRFRACCHWKHGSRCCKDRQKNLAKRVIHHVEAQAVGTCTCIDVTIYIDWKE
eukprot:scaffold32155_cov41-Attheya_sp.AAC.1